jgi:hypothetical protein
MVEIDDLHALILSVRSLRRLQVIQSNSVFGFGYGQNAVHLGHLFIVNFNVCTAADGPYGGSWFGQFVLQAARGTSYGKNGDPSVVEETARRQTVRDCTSIPAVGWE